jgi:predicted DsbA family dithiol-disulfide isomerase
MAQPWADEVSKEKNVNVNWRPFPLRPAASPEGDPWIMSTSERKFFEKIVVERSKNLDMDVKVPTFRPHSLVALEAAEAARAQGQFVPFRQAVFDAYWSENQNISQFDVLRNIASSIPDLDVEALARDVTNEVYRPTVAAAVAEVETIRRKVLPLFRRGGYVMYGLPRDYSRLRRFVEISDREPVDE